MIMHYNADFTLVGIDCDIFPALAAKLLAVRIRESRMYT